WASLKMNQFSRFKVFQGLTLLCAITFVGIKSYEYHDKFTHYEIILADGRVADGHLIERTKDEVVIHGHIVADREELMHPVKGVQHTEIRIPTANIAKYPGPKEELRMQNYGPWHNTYLAIYFTL